MKVTVLGSYAYRYGIGFREYMPDKPMTVRELLVKARALGFQGVQLCENLKIAQMSPAELEEVRETAREQGLFLEVGMNGAREDSLYRHLDIACQLSSGFVRIALGGKSCKKQEEIEQVRKDYTQVIRAVLPAFRERGVTMGIENHFDLPTWALREMVEEIDDDRVKLILDTTNCIHFLERPEEALEICRGRLASVHLKDYTVQKIEAGHLVSGTVLGEGELNVQPFLECCDQITLEMTVRRSAALPAAEVVPWENAAVTASANRLHEYLQMM